MSSASAFDSSRFLRWIIRYDQVEFLKGFDSGAEVSIHFKRLDLLFRSRTIGLV